jgi:hypothetical protein
MHSLLQFINPFRALLWVMRAAEYHRRLQRESTDFLGLVSGIYRSIAIDEIGT